jgi:thioredoxin 1
MTLELTAESFQEDVLQAELPVLVDFWASWCGPCKSLAPTLEELSEQYAGQVVIAKIEADKNKELAAQYNVRSIPCLIMFKNGTEIDRWTGNIPKVTLCDIIARQID